MFTSGGTESNNLAIRGIAAQAPATRRRIVTSTVEHPATTAPLALLEASGWTLTRVPVAASGILDLDAGLGALGDDVALVTVMLAQNETGALMPVAELAADARAYGAIVHTDAAQAIGKIPVSVDDLGVDLLSIAAHKCYGPKGIGALYVRRGTPLSPLVVGAGQEGGLRPGTENVAGIVGLGAAARLATDQLTDDAARIAQLRDELWTALEAKVPGIRRHTPVESACRTRCSSRSPAPSAERSLPGSPSSPRQPGPPATPASTPPTRRSSPWVSPPTSPWARSASRSGAAPPEPRWKRPRGCSSAPMGSLSPPRRH